MDTNRINFTKKNLDAIPLPAPGARLTYHDTREPGLQVRVGASGKKQFCVFKRTKNGGPERITLGTFPDVTIEQARAKAIEIKNAMAQGVSPAARLREKRNELTFGQAFERYIEHHAIPEGLKTIDNMRGDFERYLGQIPNEPVKKHGKVRVKSVGSVNWQNKKLSTIQKRDVVHLRTALAKGSGDAAANHAVKLVRVIFNKLIEWEDFGGPNPAATVKILTIKSRERFLQKDELPRLFAALATTDNRTIRDYVLLSILTGARKANVMAMRFDAVDFDRAEWRISDTKNGDPLIVQLPAEAVDILRARRTDSSTWVFPGRGKSGHMQSPKRGVTTILDDACIADLRIHDLRRTLGSWQAITGSSLAIIGKSLGHKSVAATQIYARLSADPVRDSVARATAAMLDAGGNALFAKK